MNTGGIAGADAFAATIGTSHNKIPVSEAEGSQAVAILATAVGRPVRPPRSQCLMGLMLTPRQEGTTTQSNSTGASRSRGAAASFCDKVTFTGPTGQSMAMSGSFQRTVASCAFE
jgi:hypothetical protein